MNSEVFRFVTLRPPQSADPAQTSEDAVNLGFSKSAFIEALRQLRRDSSPRSSFLGAAEKFVSSADFIASNGKFDKKLLDFMSALQQLPDQDFWTKAGNAFTSIIDPNPSQFVQSEAYAQVVTKVADSIVAAAIDSAVSGGIRSLLVRAAKMLWLILRLAQGTPLSRGAFYEAPLILPGGVFPLPVTVDDAGDARKKQASANAVAVANSRKRVAQLAAELASYRQAGKELLNAFELHAAQAQAKLATPAKALQRANTPLGFLLPDAAKESLTDVTRAALQKAGISAAHIDIPKTLALLDTNAVAIAKQLYADTSSARAMVRVGSSVIPRDALTGGYTVAGDLGPNDNRTPGPCPPIIDTTPPDDSVTVPTGHGDARILGIADLMVVEQELLRYQLGEIARIENVLKSEVRARHFKTKDTIETTETIETEITRDKEQDLSSSERFELKTESQTVINENSSKDAGLTIHASYGPSVDATANYNSSTSTSTQQSNSASTNYAREISNKAVDRVQTRTLTRRTVTTSSVIEEVNRHSFDNKDGTADIVGVYRYVDKIYRAQIINYGKRLMLEFIVPEPAAFLRYALTNKPVDTVLPVNPEPPGYCSADGKSFTPLQVSDIDADHYLYWASKYGAQDVTPPSPTTVIARASKKSPDQMETTESNGPRKISSDLFDVTIPDGYLCQGAFINIYGETQAGAHQIVYQLQEQQGTYVEPWDDQIMFALTPTGTFPVSLNSLGFHNYEVVVTALCTETLEHLQAWQLKTFSSIMNAYNDMKSAYDQAVQEAQLKASDSALNGSNPANNKIIQEMELKKGCISLLTGQRFDLFDAVARNVAPYGYPEIDFAEAKAEGSYISFFEQSFEWNNMVYIFYPYFWGKKDAWVTIAQLNDIDPQFAQFLRAGAARVQVPVRVGFEEAILTYLSTGETWAGEGTLVNSDNGEPDPLYLSIIAELKSQTGNNNIEGSGTLSVTKNSVLVTGTGTNFTLDDENKRIIIGGVTLRNQDRSGCGGDQAYDAVCGRHCGGRRLRHRRKTCRPTVGGEAAHRSGQTGFIPTYPVTRRIAFRRSVL
jgi:hypothetical protein